MNLGTIMKTRLLFLHDKKFQIRCKAADKGLFHICSDLLSVQGQI